MTWIVKILCVLLRVFLLIKKICILRNYQNNVPVKLCPGPWRPRIRINKLRHLNSLTMKIHLKLLSIPERLPLFRLLIMNKNRKKRVEMTTSLSIKSAQAASVVFGRSRTSILVKSTRWNKYLKQSKYSIKLRVIIKKSVNSVVNEKALLDEISNPFIINAQ